MNITTQTILNHRLDYEEFKSLYYCLVRYFELTDIRKETDPNLKRINRTLQHIQRQLEERGAKEYIDWS